MKCAATETDVTLLTQLVFDPMPPELSVQISDLEPEGSDIRWICNIQIKVIVQSKTDGAPGSTAPLPYHSDPLLNPPIIEPHQLVLMLNCLAS